MSQPGGCRQGPVAPVLQPIGPAKRPPTGAWLIIINTLGLSDWGAPFLSPVPPCDFPKHSLPAHSCSPHRPLTPTAASLLSPIRPTVMASTSASPTVKSAAPTPPVPTASHANLPKPPPIAGSIPTRLPARFPRAARRKAPAAAAANTSPLPASAESPKARKSRGALPHRRRGNDVTLPREAAIGCRLGRKSPPWPRFRFESRAEQIYWPDR